MTIAVAPGGIYFGLYSDFGDVYRGEEVTYGVALASSLAADVRPVVELTLPGDLVDGGWWDLPVPSGHPRLIDLAGNGEFMEIRSTYDNGLWEGEGWLPHVSKFLVELQGPGVQDFEISYSFEDVPMGIYAYVSPDGGQPIYLTSTAGSLLTAVEKVKIWRVATFPGDPPPAPPTEFWTNFIGARERI